MAEHDLQEVQNKAAELLGKLREINVDTDVRSWPWWPFRPAEEEESRELRRYQIIRKLKDAKDDQKKLEQLERLVRFGGYKLDDTGRLTLEESKYVLGRHRFDVQKLMRPDNFIERLQCLIPCWKANKEPDWIGVAEVLYRNKLASPLECRQLTLLETYLLLRMLPGDQLGEIDTSSSIAGQGQTDDSPLWNHRGGTWEIRWDRETCYIPHQDGLYYIGRVLGSPFRHFDAVKLYRQIKGHDHGDSPQVENDEMSVSPSGFALAELADAPAIKQIRDEQVELTKQIESARRDNNIGRTEELTHQRDLLMQYLQEVLGPHGKMQQFKDAGDRVFDTVKKAVYRAHKRIKDSGPPGLYEHLDSSVKASKPGVSYHPDDSTLTWQVTLPQSKS